MFEPGPSLQGQIMFIPLLAAGLLTGYVILSRADVHDDALAKMKQYVLSIDDFYFLKQEAWKLKAWNEQLYMELLQDAELEAHMRKLKEKADLADTVRVEPTGTPAARSAPTHGWRPGETPSDRARRDPNFPGPRGGSPKSGPVHVLTGYTIARPSIQAMMQTLPADRDQAVSNPTSMASFMGFATGLRDEMTEAEQAGGLNPQQAEALGMLVKDFIAAKRGWVLVEISDGFLASYPKCMDSVPALKAKFQQWSPMEPEDDADLDFEDEIEGEDEDEDIEDAEEIEDEDEEDEDEALDEELIEAEEE